MKLNIIRPTEKKIIDIQWIDIETPVGNFVIQEEHAPMIITLKDNSEISYRLSEGSLVSDKIKHAIAHITRDSITLLINK